MQRNHLSKSLACITVAVLFLVPAVHNLGVGETSVTSVDSGDASRHGYGCVPIDTYDLQVNGESPAVSGGGVPPAWDWRDASLGNVSGNWMTVAKSQGSCGSCWGFAAVGALEAMVNIEARSPDVDVDLSEQYLLSCPPASGGCSGWNAWWAYGYLHSHGGAITEECFPYRADDGIPCADKCDGWRDTLYPVTEYDGYSDPARRDVKALLVEHGPLVAEMAVYDDFGGYDGGVYEHPGEEPTRDINHQVVITGYDDSWGGEDEGYWIVKNSWGAGWGEDGYFRIAYGDCQIEHFLIAVDTSPVVARAGGPYYTEAGRSVAFDGSKSTGFVAPVVSYSWDFDDGDTATGATPAHTYDEEGTYEVELTVTDGDGRQATSSTPVYVDGSAPDVSITRPERGKLYFFGDHRDMPLGVVIIGPVTVEATATDALSGLDRIEYYRDGELVTSTDGPSLEQKWSDARFGLHRLEVKAYDAAGNAGAAAMWVFTWM